MSFVYCANLFLCVFFGFFCCCWVVLFLFCWFVCFCFVVVGCVVVAVSGRITISSIVSCYHPTPTPTFLVNDDVVQHGVANKSNTEERPVTEQSFLELFASDRPPAKLT